MFKNKRLKNFFAVHYKSLLSYILRSKLFLCQHACILL